MAFKTILLLFLCFLVSSTAEQNCSEYQCSLVPVGEDLSSEFQLKASEEGVKLVYLQVKITGNDSYSPLNVQDEFLPDWWVYATSISEPMLSLPYDYDALSLGLLNYQVRSMIVPLKENPVGCLVALNSSCQNKVIGSALLKNVTRTIHKEDVVCVQDIKDYKWFQLLYHEDNLEYDCCITEKISGEIRCNQSARNTAWIEAFNVVLLMLEGVLVLYFPAFPLVIPDFIFNFQEELEKEEQEVEILRQELERQDLFLNLRLEPEISVISDDGMLVYKDDSSPTTFCNLLRRVISSNYSGSLRHLKFSFNIKLAFLVFCVAPTFFYLRLILALTIKRRVFDETAAKEKASLDGVELFSIDFFHLGTAFDIFILILAVSFPLVAVLFSRPRDFLLNGECLICREHFSSVGVGEDMRKHIEKWQLNLRRFVMWIIATHSYVITWAIECTSCVRYIKASERLKRSLVIACYVPVYTIILTIFGVLGVFGLFILLGGFILATMWYSPLFCVLNIAYRRLYRALYVLIKSTSSLILRITSIRKGTAVSTIFLVFVSIILVLVALAIHAILFIFLIFLPMSWLYLPCCLAILSGRFVVRVFGLTVMGLVFNSEILAHFLAFVIAAVTNILLCYYNFQNAYKEIKEMIFKCRQKHRPQNCSVDTGEEDSFPEDLYWHVIDDHRVLPIIPEFYRMLRKMALILIFVFLAFCSAILFSNPRDFGAAHLTIYLFATGAIAGLVFKGMTIGKKFTGERKQKMKKQIEKAVISFYCRRREVVVHV